MIFEGYTSALPSQQELRSRATRQKSVQRSETRRRGGRRGFWDGRRFFLFLRPAFFVHLPFAEMDIWLFFFFPLVGFAGWGGGR